MPKTRGRRSTLLRRRRLVVRLVMPVSLAVCIVPGVASLEAVLARIVLQGIGRRLRRLVQGMPDTKSRVLVVLSRRSLFGW